MIFISDSYHGTTVLIESDTLYVMYWISFQDASIASVNTYTAWFSCRCLFFMFKNIFISLLFSNMASHRLSDKEIICFISSLQNLWSSSLIMQDRPLSNILKRRTDRHPVLKLLLWLFIKPRIQKRGTEGGEYGERGECSIGFRGISKMIPRNVIILTSRGMLKKIPGNVSKNSGKRSRRSQGMLKKNPGEWSRGFRRMLKKISGNVQEDSRECLWKIYKD